MSIKTILEDAAERAMKMAYNYGFGHTTQRSAILAYVDPFETSDPVIAASWLGKMVEADKTVDPDDQPKEWDDDDNCKDLVIRARVSGVCNDCVWLESGEYDEGICVAYPIRLVKETT